MSTLFINLKSQAEENRTMERIINCDIVAYLFHPSFL